MIASPNIRVIARTNLKEPKNRDFIPRYVYNTSNLSEAERLDIVSCVCNTTALSWKEFTKFYILNENSTKWDIVYDEAAPAVQLPTGFDGNVSVYDLPNTTVRAQQPVTSDTFCPIASLWPPDNETVSCSKSTYFCDGVCMTISGLLLESSKTEKFKLNSGSLLESPILLTPEVLRVLVLQHARGESLWILKWVI